MVNPTIVKIWGSQQISLLLFSRAFLSGWRNLTMQATQQCCNLCLVAAWKLTSRGHTHPIFLYMLHFWKLLKITGLITAALLGIRTMIKWSMINEQNYFIRVRCGSPPFQMPPAKYPRGFSRRSWALFISALWGPSSGAWLREGTQ